MPAPSGEKVHPLDEEQWLFILPIFICNFLVANTWNSFGLLYVGLRRQYEMSGGHAGIYGSVQLGIAFSASVFLSPVVDRYGCRVAAITGAAGCASGYVISYLVKSPLVMFLGYSIISGIGLSLFFMASAVLCLQRFTKNRALAMGIGMMGNAAGSIACPLLWRYTIEEFSWRHSLLFNAGLLLQGCVIGMFMVSPRHLVNVSKDAKRTPITYLKQVFDVSLCKNISFSLLCIGIFLYPFGSETLNLHLPSIAQLNGATLTQSAQLMALSYVFMSVCRIIVSIITNLSCVNSRVVLAVGNALEGCAWYVMLMGSSTGIYILVAILHGTNIAIGNTLCNVAAVDIVGVIHSPRCFALISLMQGAASFIGTPFTGWMLDISGDYTAPSVVNGSIMMLGTLVFLASVFVSKQESDTLSSVDRESLKHVDFIQPHEDITHKHDEIRL